jgi:hypothetical protein
MLCFDHVACCFDRGNEMADIMYNMNYMKVLEWSRALLLNPARLGGSTRDPVDPVAGPVWV